MTKLKISPNRLANIAGPRRRKPKVRRERQELQQLFNQEENVIAMLVRDAEVRAAFHRGLGAPITPLSVYADFDHSYLFTETIPRMLPRWKDLSEAMKIHLGFLMGHEFGCYAFTANLHPDLEQRWLSAGSAVEKLIQKRIGRELHRHGIADLPYQYVIEGRTRSGRSRCKLHIHGYLLADSPNTATLMKVVLESALRKNDLRKVERKRGVKVERGYAGRDRRGCWTRYILKNIRRYDKRIKGRRVFSSTPLTQITREFWHLLREE